MAWTPQQESAIEARGSSVIVSAAAGSGKTAVLTERLARILADPASGVDADRIVVVTFTNDAAAELKKRLEMKLRSLINDDPSDIHLLRQQTLLQNARISTINSFCFELIRDNITDQGITSGFGILDEADEKVLKAQAMEELLNEYSRDNYEKISYLYDRFCYRSEKRLINILNLADEFLASAAMRDRWLDTAVGEYHRDFRDSVYYSSLVKQCIRKLRHANKLTEDNAELAEKIFGAFKNEKYAAKSLEQSRSDADLMNDILLTAERNGINEDEISERAKGFGKRVSVPKDAPVNRVLLEVYSERRKEAINAVKTVASDFKSAESDFAESRKVTELLVEMLRRYQELIWERKTEKNAVSFDDGERLALEILADTDENGNVVQSEAAKAASEYYSIIMIDEYQDSNNKQDLIFKLLSKNYKSDSDGVPMYGDNAFVVGDVKQSIYGFRLANPKNFTDTLKRSVPYSPDNSSPNQSIILNCNFRSSPEVIGFVNYMFEGLMTESLGGIEYNDNEKLYYGVKYYGEFDPRRRTCISFIKETEDSVTVSGNIEAACTAERISHMLHSGTEVITGEGESRRCRPSDFCILVRGNAPTKLYVQELEALGIPAKGSEESGYLNSREISVLLDLLRIISNPLLDIPLASVLTSPMYAFSIEELAYIRSFDNKQPLYTVLICAADYGYEDFDDMILIQRIRDFLEALDGFRLSSVTMTVGRLISAIYDTTDFISVMQLYSDGDRKRANLRALVQYASNYESSTEFEGSAGLSGFIRHIDRVLENKAVVKSRTPAPSGDYVSVQTLHSSKGLEYPFVFIAETSVQFRYDNDPAVFSADGRVGYILSDKDLSKRYNTFQRSMLCAEKEAESRSEELRLLYVGLTRAKQQLFIDLRWDDTVKKRLCTLIEQTFTENGDISEIAQNAGSYSDWFWLKLMKHSDFDAICEALEADTGAFGLPEKESGEDLFTWEVCTHTSEQVIISAAEVGTPDPDEKLCQELKDLINDSYDMELSVLPAKLSVTQLTNKAEDSAEFDYTLQRPLFLAENGVLTPTERGTAVHTFFQYCNFETARNDLAAEKARMQERGYLTQAQAEAVESDTVKRFFESDLYERMLSAKRLCREKKFMVAAREIDAELMVAERLKETDGMVKGIIDVMFEEEDGIVVADYKTDRGAGPKVLADRYRRQLMLYKAAVELTESKPVKELLIYSFELGRSIVIK